MLVKSDDDQKSGNGEIDLSLVDMDMIEDPTKMETLWARELSELGVDEREVNNDTVHGIKSLAVAETQELLHYALNEMQKEINNMPEEEKRSHSLGLKLGSMYIQSLAFRLRILRSLQFEPKAAAIRYCKCLDLLLECFGVVALRRRLYITDLSKKEIEYMKTGQFQVLPSRDCLGRRILVSNMPTLTNGLVDMVPWFKVYVYMAFAIVSEDISTQKHGFVYIGIISLNLYKLYLCNDNSHKMKMNTFMRLRQVHKMYEGIPLFWGAVHLCVPPDGFRVVTALLMAFLGKDGRKLLQVHHGNHIECNYSLRSYGIPVGEMPLTHSGEIETENHLRLMRMRRKKDMWQVKEERRFQCRRRINQKHPNKAVQAFPGIECPEVDFVILDYDEKYGGAPHNHLGNVDFRKIMVETEGFTRFLEDSSSEEGGERFKVIQLVDDILLNACEKGLQFLIYDKAKDYYSEVNKLEVLQQKVELFMSRYRSQFRAQSLATNSKAVHSSSNIWPQQPLDLTEQDNTNCRGC